MDRTDPFDFNQYIQDHYTAGQSELSRTVYEILIPHLKLESLEDVDWQENAFLEPRLFSWVVQSQGEKLPLSQLLYGSIKNSLEKNIRIKARSDESGYVCLPQIGWLPTSCLNSEITINYDQKSGHASLKGNDKLTNISVINRLLVPGSRIEIIQFLDQIIASFIQKYIKDPTNFKLVSDPHPYLSPLGEALSIIHKCARDFYKLLTDCVRGIILFTHPTANSFAALGLHGYIFLNLRWPTGIAFFLDGLIHQGGHVIFSAATIQRQELFKVDPDISLTSLDDPSDGRTVYEALHGLYTENMLTRIMSDVLRLEILDRQQSVELYGRLSYICSRFKSDLHIMKNREHDIFTITGKKLYNYFDSTCQKLVLENPELLQQDLSDQGDEFDVSTFIKKNKNIYFQWAK